jgi:hypothetical protein
MATLILSTAGRLVGGPIGGAVGAFVGQQIDQRLFGAKPRRGPQLGDLAVQTSHYGTDIPKLFGRMRIAGTVIWSTDLRERRSSGGGGKGQPRTVSYSYSASFAVALSGRPILAVRRIWADGRLLRGQAGDFKSAAGFRLYLGSEAQEVDPLIASAEGVGAAPAYRGLAYAVFEDFELADYGNRIPSLTFEVEADPGEVAAAAVARSLSEGAIEAGPSPALTGFAATGESVRAAIEDLAVTAGLSLAEGPGGLVLQVPPATVDVVLGAEEIAAAPGGSAGRPRVARKGAASLPLETTLSYVDPERDFQTGLQRAARGAPGLRADRRALPAALPAAAAKAMAAGRLARLWAARETVKLQLPWRRAALRPGAVVRIAGHGGSWRVAASTLERMALELELERIPGGGGGAAPAEPGRPVGQIDLPHGPTTLVVLDSPLLTEGAPARPQLILLAAGAEPGWRRADLLASWDAGASWEPAGSTAPAAVIGAVFEPPATGGSGVLDLRSSLEVELLSESMWLESRTDAALAGGANLAAVGNELIQFGSAVPLGDRRFRLSRLLRGRRGTEWAASGHAAGESFALLDAATMTILEAPLAAVGAEARMLASGVGDTGADPAAVTVTGEAMRPPAPVHLRVLRQPNGDVAVGWVRRSRSGWVWLDGSDAPLGEAREAYRLTLAAAGSTRTVEVAEPGFLYTAAQQASDGAAAPMVIEVVQLGDAGASRPATFILD